MRDKTRKAAEAVAMVLVAPLVIVYRLKVAGFDATGSALSLIPGHFGVFLRRAWYAQTLEHCGTGLSVQFGSVINTPLARIGNDCFIGHWSRIGLASIGNDVMIGEHSSVISGGGQYGFMRRDIPMRLQPGHHARVEIGDDIWIGSGAVIASDVASHSIVSAGSTVTRLFSEWEILSGVPAESVATRPARRARRSAPRAVSEATGEPDA